jgi:hypothetical protein
MRQDLAEEGFRAFCAGRCEEIQRDRCLDDLAIVHEDDAITDLANPISWVTQIMVMPSRARSVMTSSTSEIISGSSADVGSSNSITLGFMQSARAIATRCCCPPESCDGYLFA